MGSKTNKVEFKLPSGRKVSQLDFPLPDDYGFVYLLEYKSGMQYVGKKSFYSIRNIEAKLNGDKRKGHIKFFNRRKPMTEKDLSSRSTSQIRTNVKTKLVKFEKVSIAGSWAEYEGSSNLTKADKVVSKKILFIAKNKRTLDMYEDYFILKHKALQSDNFYNDNIRGRFFPIDISIRDLNDYKLV